ncbi:DUF6476 family protein [Mesobacterium sp. TK19101]|uniref:DUF6476 family protein n=1 Tax=Mesobacterium hydrothermale TaxID=3111907 RepID=A0ABU6HBZ2_9RHOB|nr:DUF6476 family protein [Mesobacterium sp. TK19101]MEC3859993.1 DUF6476 family protein [Mesobacterium sp. TK19101]
MDNAPDPEFELPASLRVLRLLVTVLMVVMIAGIVIIVGLIWSRYSGPAVPMPEVITLPAGTTATAFTRGAGWYAVVTADNRILIFDADSGALTQEIALQTAN